MYLSMSLIPLTRIPRNLATSAPSASPIHKLYVKRSTGQLLSLLPCQICCNDFVDISFCYRSSVKSNWSTIYSSCHLYRNSALSYCARSKNTVNCNSFILKGTTGEHLGEDFDMKKKQHIVL